jgi:hypothetical protein
MTTTMNLKEKFELSGGVTVLACVGYDLAHAVIGKQFCLVLGGEVKQVITITGERDMLNKNSNVDQRAFETNDVVLLSSDDVRSGDWFLIEQ